MFGRWRRLTTLPALVMLSSLVACSEPNEPEPKLGSLAITVSGLPDDTPADIVVTGPGGFSRSATGPVTLTDLQPGTYTVQASRVRTDLATFDPVTGGYSLDVGAGASQATVVYTVITGSLAINVTGLPDDVPWKVRVTGPNGFRDSVSASITLGNLAPGLYTLSTGEVRKGVNIYLPRLGEQIRSVPASVSPVQANVPFDLITGLLTVHVNGLPAGTAGSVTVTGPGEFNEQVTSTTLLEGLVSGRYTLAASSVSHASAHYTPSPAQQTVTVTPGGSGLASVNYSTAMAGLNLTIDAVHLQQVVQNSGGAVPTIADRDALFRVFVRASQPNDASPAVRVQVYHGNELKLTTTIPAQAPGVPTAIDEGDLAASWNLPIPKELIRPGLRILADVDPGNAVAESAESDNTYPSSGVPLPLDVRTVPPLAVRFVPVTQTATGLTGDITVAHLPLYAEPLRKLLPVNDVALELRTPFVSNAAALQPNDANGAWMQVLSEINALRAAEGSTAHYYGVVKTSYSTGVIGMSYLPSFAAIGWDRPPSAYPTFVHEIGHHFGRLHSPGCGAGGPDAAYPYQGGAIGVLGFDAGTQSLIPPSARDIMTYCDDRWISDYTYTGILGFRAQTSGVFAAAQSPATPSLLLWGRIEANRVVLEPAFVVNAPPRLPTFGGPNRLELRDSTGRSLLSLSFTGERVVDGPVPGAQFAFVVPLALVRSGNVAEIRLTSAGRASSIVATGESFVPTVDRVAADRVRIRWSHVPGRGLIVRDESGAILSLARGGMVEVRTRSTRLDLTLSDGVRSVRRTAVPR